VAINDDIIRKKQRKEAFRDSLGQETQVIDTAMEKTIDAPFHDFHRCSAVLFLSTLF
jgi:hypothetical protein